MAVFLRSWPGAATLYAATWIAAAAYQVLAGLGLLDALVIGGAFGIGLSLLAWWTTRAVQAPRIDVPRAAIQSLAFLVFVLFYALLFLGPGMSLARHQFPAGAGQEWFVMGLKLVVHVFMPCLILIILGDRLRPLFQIGLRNRKFWLTLALVGAAALALNYAFGQTQQFFAVAQPSPALLAWAIPASFVWVTIEAGLNEEFLFRAVLQSRLAALFNSPYLSVVVTALLFALAHAPGIYLRGGPGVDGWSQDPLMVAAQTITTISPLGLTLGIIYQRTKSLLLVVLLHGLIDFLPNLPRFMSIWS